MLRMNFISLPVINSADGGRRSYPKLSKCIKTASFRPIPRWGSGCDPWCLSPPRREMLPPRLGAPQGARTYRRQTDGRQHTASVNVHCLPSTYFYLQNKTLHVDEIEVVDFVDSSTSLCLFVHNLKLCNVYSYSRKFRRYSDSEVRTQFSFSGFFC